MTGVRILRVLEYTYKDIETAIGDQERWTHSFSVPYMRMRSATVSMDTLGWVEEENREPVDVSGFHCVERDPDEVVVFDGNQLTSDDLARIFKTGERFSDDEQVAEVVIRSKDGSYATWTREEN